MRRIEKLAQPLLKNAYGQYLINMLSQMRDMD